MVSFKQWIAMPIAIAATALYARPALSQPIVVTPTSPPMQVSGVSGGDRRDDSCAGFIASAPNHTVQVTEDADLRFVLQGSGQLALLIRSSTGKTFCVPSDRYSSGKIEIPGRWHQGSYSVYVGDQAKESHPYTLTISSNQ